MAKLQSEIWVMRDELLIALHRWPMILIYVLAGGLFGFLISYIWPSPYRAVSSLSVELNPYRALDDRAVAAFAQVDFRNVDDYKHWQMSQLNVLVLSDEYLGATLERLRKEDAYWNDLELGNLRDLLQVSWRNAGEWRVSARADSIEHSREALKVWKNVILEMTNTSLDHSRELFDLELALRAIEEEKLAAQIRRVELQKSRDSLLEFSEEYSSNSAFLDSDRWRLWSLVASVAGFDEGWKRVLDASPATGADFDEILIWIDRTLVFIDGELNSVDTRLVELESSFERVNLDWEGALAESRGLAATLAVVDLNPDELEVIQVRTASLTATVGSAIGALAWGLVFLAQIQRRQNH